MSETNKGKHLLFRAVAKGIQKIRLYNYFNFRDDSRPDTSFTLVLFCGEAGMDYLNASLFSVYRNWKFLPKVIVVSDGTPTDYIKQHLIKWPREIKVILWEEAALYYKNKGEQTLYNIALKKLWPGKKLVSLLYLAEKGLILYCDTDVLWFSSPEYVNKTNKPYMKLAKDVAPFYSTYVSEHLREEENLYKGVPYNCGVMYLNGDFSSYPKWAELWKTWEANPDIKDFFSEQTAWALLNIHFNKNDFWKDEEVLIKVDDTHSLKYTHKAFPELIARHYVSEKKIIFWRDFFYMAFVKKKYQ